MNVVTPDGDPLHVAHDEAERGAKGQFFPVYRDPGRERRYGYVCGNCESLDNAMDAMGRVECNACGNLRKPDEWDAAHE